MPVETLFEPEPPKLEKISWIADILNHAPNLKSVGITWYGTACGKLISVLSNSLSEARCGYRVRLQGKGNQ